MGVRYSSQYIYYELLLIWVKQKIQKCCFVHPYKVEIEHLSISRVVFVIEERRLTNVGGQKVAPHKFIFPPFMLVLPLEAKNTALQ